MVVPMQPSGGRGPAYDPKSPIQPIQIIAFAMMQGLMIFAAIAVFFVVSSDDPGDESSLPVIATAVAAVVTVLRFIVPPMMASGQMRTVRSTMSRDDEQGVEAAAYGVFQTRTIIEDALLEGACFFVLIAFLLSKQWWLLGVAGALVALMIASFPTRGRIEHFIHEQKQQLDFEGEQ
jgi:hypothetical protein